MRRHRGQRRGGAGGRTAGMTPVVLLILAAAALTILTVRSGLDGGAQAGGKKRARGSSQ